jgi:transposase-like protein
LPGHLKLTNKSWRVDETYIRVPGRWCYFYRANDSTSANIDFLLLALRDAASAQRLVRKALRDPWQPQHRVINTDKARLYDALTPPLACVHMRRHPNRSGSTSGVNPSLIDVPPWRDVLSRLVAVMAAPGG